MGVVRSLPGRAKMVLHRQAQDGLRRPRQDRADHTRPEGRQVHPGGAGRERMVGRRQQERPHRRGRRHFLRFPHVPLDDPQAEVDILPYRRPRAGVGAGAHHPHQVRVLHQRRAGGHGPRRPCCGGGRRERRLLPRRPADRLPVRPHPFGMLGGQAGRCPPPPCLRGRNRPLRP